MVTPRPRCSKLSAVVHDVVQGVDLEDAQQQGVGLVTGERHRLEVGGDAGHEAEHADQEEHRPHRGRRHLKRRGRFSGLAQREGRSGHDARSPSPKAWVHSSWVSASVTPATNAA